jgi:hypothetical protein
MSTLSSSRATWSGTPRRAYKAITSSQSHAADWL